MIAPKVGLLITNNEFPEITEAPKSKPVRDDVAEMEAADPLPIPVTVNKPVAESATLVPTGPSTTERVQLKIRLKLAI